MNVDPHGVVLSFAKMDDMGELESDKSLQLEQSKDRKPKYNLGIWTALMVGCLSFVAVGTRYIFNLYQNDVKATFNYTQSEVAVMASVLNIGAGIYILPGMIFDKFGPRSTSLTGLVLMSSGFLLIWSTTRMVDFYRSRSWLQYIYFLAAGTGGSYIYIAALNTNMINFPPKHRSKIAAILNAFVMGSSIFYILVYHRVFGSNNQQRYSRFMMMSLGLSLVIGLLSVIFLRIYDERKHNGGITNQRDSVSPCLSDRSDCNEEPERQVTARGKLIQDKTLFSLISFVTLIKDIKFLLFSTVWIITLSTVVAFMTNITTTTKSMQYDKYEMFFLLLIPIVDTISGLIFGFLYDKTRTAFRRSLYVVLSTVLCTLSVLLPTFAADNLPAFVLAVVSNAITGGILYTTGLAHIANIVESQKFGTVYGILATILVILIFAVQSTFGAIYDTETEMARGVICYGMPCVRGGYGLLLALQVIAMVLSVIFSAKTRFDSSSEEEQSYKHTT